MRRIVTLLLFVLNVVSAVWMLLEGWPSLACLNSAAAAILGYQLLTLDW